MKKIILTAFTLFFVTTMFAQSFGEIQGKISDENGNPMPFVYVALKTATTTMDTQTDLDGKFKIKPVPVGSYSLQASSIGYNDLLINNVVVSQDFITRLFDLVMTESTTIIPIVDIIATPKPLINPEETSIRTIDMKDFEHSPTKTVTGVITAVSSEISTGDNGELYFRGSRNGSTVMYLDGVKIMGDGLPNIPSSGINNVMVYTGGVPAKYGDTTGGVVVIETKNFFTEYYKRQTR